MAYITDREQALHYIERLREKKVSMALICTASYWNTEAILYAAQNFAKRHKIKEIPVAIGITYNYEHMSQAERVTFSKDPKAGFISIMEHLKTLCGDENSPYSNVVALPHLDHGDPKKDLWPMTEGIDYLASVMFDAQKYPFEENIRLTREYVEKYGDKVLVEGIMDQLAVLGESSKADDNYVDKAIKYIEKTNVDFLVADLGTEQQASTVGDCTYLKDRAQNLTKALGQSMLVLHGTSSLSKDQMESLAEDGVVRVNMWTRIAREAGQYAAEKMLGRARSIFEGRDFEDIESKVYFQDSIVKAAEIIEDVLDILGYVKLGKQH